VPAERSADSSLAAHILNTLEHPKTFRFDTRHHGRDSPPAACRPARHAELCSFPAIPTAAPFFHRVFHQVSHPAAATAGANRGRRTPRRSDTARRPSRKNQPGRRHRPARESPGPAAPPPPDRTAGTHTVLAARWQPDRLRKRKSRCDLREGVQWSGFAGVVLHGAQELGTVFTSEWTPDVRYLAVATGGGGAPISTRGLTKLDCQTDGLLLIDIEIRPTEPLHCGQFCRPQ
jgi:hypothetical protein